MLAFLVSFWPARLSRSWQSRWPKTRIDDCRDLGKILIKIWAGAVSIIFSGTIRLLRFCS